MAGEQIPGQMTLEECIAIERGFYVLDPGLEEQSERDLSLLAVQQFLDWAEPPTKITLHPLGGGRWAVEAVDGRRE